MVNPYSEEERQQAMIAACYSATRKHFAHLPLRYVINPPVDMLDAALARQIAIVILIDEFGIPRRRIGTILGLARSTILSACRTVDYRREDAAFDKIFQRIVARAKDNFMRDLREAA